MSSIMFGLKFESVMLKEAVDIIADASLNKRKGLVVTPNVDHVVMMESDSDMRLIFQEALFSFADGMPIVWLSRLLLDSPLPERVTGADLFPALCETAAAKGLNVFFLGGNPGVADTAARKLKSKNPDLNICGTYCPPYGFESDEQETRRIIDLINTCKPDILFVGVGTPKQEKWAYKNCESLNTGPILCIGASFDFIAGTLKRAPVIIQKSGFEWLWRLIKEPRRLWRRYLLRDSRFIFLALREIYISKKKRQKSN